MNLQKEDFPPALTNRVNPMDFRPLKAPASIFAPVVAEGLRLSGFDDDRIPQESPLNLCQTLQELYPTLSFCELARLWKCFVDGDILIPEPLFKFYGIRDLGFAEPLFEFVLGLSVQNQDLLSRKQMALGDLRSIKPLRREQYSVLNQFLTECERMRLSKSQIVEVCELSVELLELDYKIETLLPESNEAAESWLGRIRTLRYPESSQKDKSRENQIKNLSWPNKCQARWLRQGDLTGVEIKLFSSHASELDKQLRAVEKLKEDLWKSP